MKTFTTTGVCTKENNYMVDITDRLVKMKAMVDAGNYFTVTRGRQYGKTTTLTALAKFLKNEYVVISLDFQNLDDGSFENGSIFTQALSQLMIDEYEFGGAEIPQNYIDAFEDLCQKETAKVRMAENLSGNNFAYTGTGFGTYADLIADFGNRAVRAESQLPDAVEIAELAAIRLAAGEKNDPENVLPVYLRDKVSWKKVNEQ